MKTAKEIEDEIKANFVHESSWSHTYSCDIEDYEARFELVEQEEWTQEHKDQYRQSIYFDIENDCYIAVNESRSGSYHSGFESYEAPTIEVVRKVEKEVTKIEVTWETVSSSSIPSQAPVPKG